MPMTLRDAFPSMFLEEASPSSMMMLMQSQQQQPSSSSSPSPPQSPPASSQPQPQPQPQPQQQPETSLFPSTLGDTDQFMNFLLYVALAITFLFVIDAIMWTAHSPQSANFTRRF